MFGADQIVWVEGPTERECFPLILQHAGAALPTGCRFVPVVSTAELSRNNIKAQALVNIYLSICRSNAILPPAIAISLDRESFNDEQINAMQLRFGGLVHFLERRCVENYVLNLDAINHVIFSEGYQPDEREDLINILEKWMNENAGSALYKAPREWNGDIRNPPWLKKVDGAKLLATLFVEITDAKHIYNKVRHTPKMLAWILDNCPEDVESLRLHVVSLISPLTHPSSAPR